MKVFTIEVNFSNDDLGTSYTLSKDYLAEDYDEVKEMFDEDLNNFDYDDLYDLVEIKCYEHELH